MKPFYFIVLLFFIVPYFACDGMTEREIESISEKTYQNHIQLRVFLQGNKNAYLYAFELAYRQQNYVRQILLANAYFSALADKDREKRVDVVDYASYNIFALASRQYDPWILLFSKYYKKLHPNFRWVDREGKPQLFDSHYKIACKVYREAATESCSPAQLVELLFPPINELEKELLRYSNEEEAAFLHASTEDSLLEKIQKLYDMTGYEESKFYCDLLEKKQIKDLAVEFQSIDFEYLCGVRCLCRLPIIQ